MGVTMIDAAPAGAILKGNESRVANKHGGAKQMISCGIN